VVKPIHIGPFPTREEAEKAAAEHHLKPYGFLFEITPY
jgi:hypothetical protein